MATICSMPRASLFVDVDDNLWSCGFGVLTDQEASKVPSMVEGVPPIHSVSAFGLVLLLDVEGYVWQVQNRVANKLADIPAIKSISTGNSHALLLDVNGDVWGLGRNAHGQLGNYSRMKFDDNVYLPTKIQNIPTMQSICVAYNHSLLLDVEGRVWGSGNNGDNRLGLKNTPTVPTIIEIDTQIQSLSSGWIHSLFIDVNDSLLSCGGNRTLQQGLESKRVDKVTKHSTLPKVRLATGAQYHSIFVDMNDSVWVCGSNFTGQLGTEPNPKLPLQRAALFDSMPAVCSISSLEHSLFLDVEGSVWSCGKNDVGQLGLDEVKDQVHIPTKIESIPPIKNLVTRIFRSKSARNI